MSNRTLLHYRSLLCLMALSFVFSGCIKDLPATATPEKTSQVITATISPTIRPSITTTPSPLPTATPTITPSPTSTITPTIVPTLLGNIPGEFLLYDYRKNVVLLYRADGSYKKTIYFFNEKNWSQPWNTAQWSPDGNKILIQDCSRAYDIEDTEFAKYLGCDLLLITLDEQEKMKEVKLPVKIRAGANWSPDGKKLTFIALKEEGTFGLHVLDVLSFDNQELPYKLPGRQEYNLHPAFTKDGKKIIWCADNDLMSINLDGSNAKKEMGCGIGEYDISRNGNRITFPGGSYLNSIMIMDIDGKNKRKLSDRSDLDNRHPIFSPDEDYIVYFSYGWKGAGKRLPPVGSDYIYIVKTDGSKKPVMIGVSAGGSSTSRWSPDEQYFLFYGWLTEQPNKRTATEPECFAIRPDLSQTFRIRTPLLCQGSLRPGASTEGIDAEIFALRVILPAPQK